MSNRFPPAASNFAALAMACVVAGFVADAAAQFDHDAEVRRALMQRQQQSESFALGVRQSQQVYEAQSRGASTAELRDLESRQLGQRQRQDALEARQQLHMQTLPQPVAPGRAQYEATRAQQERDAQRSTFDAQPRVASPGFFPPEPRPTLQP